MKITVNTFGTRGDIQPYIALSLGLREAGHDVRIVTHQIFETFVRDFKLDFHPLEIDPRQVLINQAISEFGNNIFRITRWMEMNFKTALHDIFLTTLEASHDADLMLNSALSFAGWHVAEKLDVPALATYLWPVTPSRYLPGATGKITPPWLPFKGIVNYFSTKLSNQMFFNLLLPSVNQCRREILDLPSMKAWDYWPLDSARSRTALIYGYSPVVIPKPPDWSKNQQISGYWFLDISEGYQPAPELRTFLAEGPAPIYVGFGSMVDHEKEAITQFVIDALEEAGQRGILLGGWSELGTRDLPNSILLVNAVPHDWLFPQMAAVVHHGGAGTTAAGLKAGIPSVVVPFFGDQFFWGWRVQELGTGPRSIPRKKLSVNSLVKAIQQVIHNEEIKDKAALIGEKIRNEDGVEVAVKMIESFSDGGTLSNIT